MPTSLEVIVSFLEEQGYSHTVRSEGPEPVITTGFGTSQYRNADGDPGVQLVIQLMEEGEYVHIFAPMAFDLSECEHKAAALEAFAGIQWRLKMGRFEYDTEDGEIRPNVGFALEDAPLTSRQFHRLLGAIPAMLDQWHACIVRAMKTGVVDFETPAADSDSKRISFDNLSEFTELGVGAADIIGQCEADLDLSGLESITADDVRALSRKTWTGTESLWHTFDLNLSGLKTLPSDVAKALARRFEGVPDFMQPATLRLDGIESLSVDVARTLATYAGDLHLNGLQTIDTEVATALATHKAELYLNGLSTLTDDAAKALASHLGNMHLDGLTELSEAVAAHLLALLQPKISEQDTDDALASRDISLGGIERLTPSVASLFVLHAKAQGNGIWLDNVRVLDAETAAVLGQHNGDLMLRGLDSLDGPTANELARCGGQLCLGGLQSLSAEVAKALATHEGALSLDSVKSLSDAEAESLASHRGFLDLGELRELSADGARYLVKHVGKLVIPLAELPDEVQEILREHPSLFEVEPDVPTRLPTAVHAGLASVGIAEVRAQYAGSGDDGGFESFAVSLADGRILDGVHDADQLAAALQEARGTEADSDKGVQPVAKMLYQLIWGALPSGWEIDDGSFGEVVIDVPAKMMTLSHTWRHESDSEDEDHAEDGDEDSDSDGECDADASNTESSQTDWGDAANQDRLIAADTAELADLLRRGVPRKAWLDAHIERVPLWEQAAERGTAPGLMITGLCHWFGIGRDVDHDAAQPFIEQAAKNGEPQAQFSLGQLISIKAREGEGSETAEDAYRWFLASAKSGLAQAQFSVAVALWKGEGIDEDEKAAIEWMKIAAKQGHGQAALMLADLHLTDRPQAGIKRNRAAAIEWGRLAAAAGYEEADAWLQKHERGMVLTTDAAEQILKDWRENNAEDDEPPPASAGPFADPTGTITNSIGMKLVPIPAGEFLMGSSKDCPLGDADEEFQHRVRITKPFLIGMHQVTQAQYEEVTGGNPSFFTGPDLPVEHLSWKEAQRFCELLSSLPGERQAGRRYRLPTEAEWEYACRAGTSTPFNTGDSLEPHQARFASTNRGSPKQTAPVGTYPPNAWGLFDMHGNVWEWTSDWFSADYFRESPADDPPGPDTGTHHTLRGGSASVEAHECRTTIRGEASAVDGPTADLSKRYAFYGDFGIRVACDVAPTSARGGSAAEERPRKSSGRAKRAR